MRQVSSGMLVEKTGVVRLFVKTAMENQNACTYGMVDNVLRKKRHCMEHHRPFQRTIRLARSVTRRIAPFHVMNIPPRVH
jgi:hypothetical protein